MTEEEYIFLAELKNKFWREFSDLCNRRLAEAEKKYPHLRAEAEMMLSESTSFYGRRPAPRPSRSRT